VSLSHVELRPSTFTLQCNEDLPLVLDEYVKVSAEHCQLTSLNVNIFGGNPSSRSIMVQFLLLTDNRISHLANFTFARCGKMKSIDLSNNEISTVMPLAFHGLGDLKKLNLDGNKISQLVSSLLSDLNSLEYFLIRGNLLVTVDLSLFCNKANMLFLDLGQNRIKNLECTQHECNEIIILYVSLDQNDLIDVSKLQMVTKLKQLNLSDNKNLQISSLEVRNFPKLLELSLAGTNLQKLKGKFRFLSALTSLQTLNIMNNDLDQFPPEQLPLLLRVNDLNIAKNRINSLDTDLLFQKFPNLRSITMSENNWDCINLKEWMKQIMEKNIDVNFNGSRRIQGQENNVKGVGCLYKSDENSKNIVELKAELKEVQHRKGLIIVVLVVLNIIQMMVISKKCCVKPKQTRPNAIEMDGQSMGIKTYMRNEFQTSFDTVSLPLPPPPPLYV
jgi:Leucine-rich repeat (LRR) protein